MAWQPNLDCDGHTAESRAQWLVSNMGLGYEAAKRQVIDEFPSVFLSLPPLEPSPAIAWRPDAMCDGHTAEARAQWLIANQSLSISDARTTVMSEFTEVFATATGEPCIATIEQCCHLRDTGYLVMHGCVDRAAVQAARQCATVQAALGVLSGHLVGGRRADPAPLALALPVWPTARCSAMTRRSRAGRKWPSNSRWRLRRGAPDGSRRRSHRWPARIHNGVPPGEIHNFTMLVGVALTDMPAPNMGNLGVIPCLTARLRAAARSVWKLRRR